MKKFSSVFSICLIISVIFGNFSLPVLAYEKDGVNFQQVNTTALPYSKNELSNIAGVDVNSLKDLSINKINKNNLSEPKKKLGTDLLKLVDSSFLLPTQNRTQIVSEMKELKQFVASKDSVASIDKRATNKTHNDLVHVYVNLQPTTPTSVIDSIAWKVTDRDEKNHLAVALVDVNKLETLASLSGVKSISSVLPPITNSGSVITEGDIIHQTDDVRSTYSQSGAGIKIGVISNGVDNIASAKSTGDLPAGVTVLSNSEGGDEGTAMLEIIYDMVPSASLYFHDAGNNMVAFNSAIDDLIAAGVNVIVDDVAWKGAPFFEDGIIASHVASALAANNIIYVSSAGNQAENHYQGVYYNNGSNYHDFSSGTNSTYKNLYVNIPSGGSVDVILQWNDSFGSSGNDYDLIMDNADGSVQLDSSLSLQDGTGDPIEIISYTNTTGNSIVARIWVNNYNGLAMSKTLELFIWSYGGAYSFSDNITTADSIFGLAAVPGVIAVGAIDANDPGNDTIEPYSSQGPVTIIGQAQRAKPDIIGIDCVKITGAGGFPSPFCGTSAAAPAVAAIVAQLWGQYPSATGNQIRNQLLNTAVDLGVAGTDMIYGHGRADSLLSFQAGPAVSSFNFSNLSPTVTGSVNNTNHTISLTVPYGTNITSLAPTIAVTGASVSPASGSSRNFTSPVTYTVTAASGLAQAYVVTVTVAGATGYTISGTIKYYDGIKTISSTTVILEDNIGTQIATTTTNASGTYQFVGVPNGGNYVVRASKSDNAAGLTGADQTKIRRHVVGLELFDSIYKKIAGDVNNSGSLTGTDQTKIRRFIVGLDSNLPSGAWKFYSSDTALTTLNYLTDGLTRIYTNLIANMSNQNFVGVKMGDVNNSWVNN